MLLVIQGLDSSNKSFTPLQVSVTVIHCICWLFLNLFPDSVPEEINEREARLKRREWVLRVHVVWVCLMILCGMPLSPRLWLATLLLLQASKSASLPTALIRGSLPRAGDKLAESVRKCTHHASLTASRHGPGMKGGVATSSNLSHDSSAFLSYP